MRQKSEMQGKPMHTVLELTHFKAKYLQSFEHFEGASIAQRQKSNTFFRAASIFY